MKKLLFLFFSLCFSFSVLAQAPNLPDRPALTPEQKLSVANAVTAIIVGPVALPAAMLSGQKEALCHVLEGHKQPSSFNNNSDGRDQCPGGIWLRAIPYVKGLIND